MRKERLRFILIVPYLMATAVLLFKAYFFPDYSSFVLGVSDFLLMLLTSPWIFLFSPLVGLSGLEGNSAAEICMVGSVAINAAVLYYIGKKFERAPDSLF